MFARISTRATTLILVLLPLLGCPPPSIDDISNDNSASNANDNSPSGDDPGVGPELSAVRRSALLSELESMLPSLTPENVESTRDSVVSMLKSNADILDAGANEDGSVWAIFSDGAPLLVALNNPISLEDLQREEAAALRVEKFAAGRTTRPPSAAAATGPGGKDTTGARSQTSGAQTRSIPQSSKVYLLNGFADNSENVRHLDHLAAWFTQRGYQDAAPNRDATIENLMQVKDAGVLYINGHGGIGYIPVGPQDGPKVNVPIFALGTLTRRTSDGASDRHYRDLIHSQQVGFLVIPTVFGIPLAYGPQSASRYFVTREFAFQHWTFSAGSWVYLDVCDGDDRVFKDACKDKGAGLFLSWDRTVRNSDSLETSQYLFSRVLGINDIFGGARVVAEEPPQRAFDLAAILIDMRTRIRRNPHTFLGAQDTLLESYSLHNPADHGRAELNFKNLGGVQDALLVPAIQIMSIDDHLTSTLLLNGSFGAESGTVSVGGLEAVIDEWTSGMIRCRISPAAAGPVVVALNGHASDPRQLTLWRGTATATRSGPNLTTDTCTLHVEFRGDAQSSRFLPGDTPMFHTRPNFRCIPQNSRVESASEIGVLACGNGVTGEVSVTTPPGSLGDLPYINSLDSGDGYYFQPTASRGISLDSETGELSAELVFGVRKANAVNWAIRCGVGVPRNQPNHLDPSGAALLSYGVGSYDMNENVSATEGNVTLSVTIHLSATHTPSDDDPR